MSDARPPRRPARPPRKPFLLRLPPEVLEELRGWASQELRSLNGHLEYLLRDALRRRRGDDPATDGDGPAEPDGPGGGATDEPGGGPGGGSAG